MRKSHNEVAREIVRKREDAHALENEILYREIEKALQDAFDCGFRAAGGTVGSSDAA